MTKENVFVMIDETWLSTKLKVKLKLAITEMLRPDTNNVPNTFATYDEHQNTWSCLILNNKGQIEQKIYGKTEQDAINKAKLFAGLLKMSYTEQDMKDAYNWGQQDCGEFGNTLGFDYKFPKNN